MKPLSGAALLLFLVSASASAQSGDSAIVSAGSEQAVRVGDVTLSRPFGAQLVDRLAVAGSYGPKRGPRLHLIRGEAGGDCPARYVVIEAPRGGEPVISDPFGTCSPAATAQLSGGRLVVTMPATAAGGPPVRFAYRDGDVSLLDARPAAAVAEAGAVPGHAAPAPSTCRSAASVDAATQAEVLAEFETSYPAEYRRARALKQASIDPAELRGLLTGMACLSTWPGSERVVEAARPLFESRHGPAAFATLDAIARDPLTEANLQAAARRFSAEMSFQAGQAALSFD